MSCVGMSHDADEQVISHIWMSHVTHDKEDVHRDALVVDRTGSTTSVSIAHIPVCR